MQLNAHQSRLSVGSETRLPEECDVLVIGSGIGGLTCANYLAKAGARVVLVEKHYVPGGYCSSFERGGYYFDAGAHFLGSCRPDGQVGRLISDHRLDKKFSLVRCDPSDVIVSQNREVFIFNDLRRTIAEFQEKFPDEATSVEAFFKFLTETDAIQLYVRLKDKTFAELLDHYFKHWEIKSVLATLLGNIGLPSSRASALTSAFLYREFILDGGYYPKGGMQRFADALLERFEEYGGTALFLSSAEEILLDGDDRVRAVKIRYCGKRDLEIRVQAVVANCDPFQLQDRLLRKTKVSVDHNGPTRKRIPTVSAFMVHLGINHDIYKDAKYHCNLWSYKKGHVDAYYEGVMAGEIDYGLDSFLFLSIPTFHDAGLLPQGHHSVQAILAAPFFERDVWDKYKEKLAEDVLRRIEQYIPGVKNWIEVQRIAIPPTLYKYTANYRGAMYGWASIPEQVGKQRIPEETSIGGLYLAGQWAGLPSGHSGIPTVVTSGRNVSRIALRQLRRSRCIVSSSKEGNGLKRP